MALWRGDGVGAPCVTAPPPSAPPPSAALMFSVPPVTLSLGMDLLGSFERELGRHERSRQELANAEKLFDLPITMYPELLKVQKEMTGLRLIYELYEALKVSRGPRTEGGHTLAGLGRSHRCWLLNRRTRRLLMGFPFGVTRKFWN